MTQRGDVKKMSPGIGNTLCAAVDATPLCCMTKRMAHLFQQFAQKASPKNCRRTWSNTTFARKQLGSMDSRSHSLKAILRIRTTFTKIPTMSTFMNHRRRFAQDPLGVYHHLSCHTSLQGVNGVRDRAKGESVPWRLCRCICISMSGSSLGVNSSTSGGVRTPRFITFQACQQMRSQ